MRLSLTNVGTLGNAFRGYRDGSSTPSCEYPAGSGVEHLFEGGFWIGGTFQGLQFVSTSAYDAPQGYATGRNGFEFTAEVGSTLEERSSLFDSPFFTPEAISHQDYVAEFSDSNLTVPGTNIQIGGHTQPMDISVRMEAYNWNYSFSDFFVILNLHFINSGDKTFDNTHIALWANTVVRNINITPAGSGGATFYSQGGNGYLDTLYMAYCYDATGDVGFTDSYVGQKFLGADYKGNFRHPALDTAFKVHYNAWDFNNSASALYFFPSTEDARYQKMIEGFNDLTAWTDPSILGQTIPTQLNQPGNRSDLISVGPFDNFAPGDTVTIAFAIVVGQKNDDGNPNTANTDVQRENLVTNAEWAQTAFNGEDVNFNGLLDPGEDQDGNGRITRYILPAPPDIPKTRVEVSENSIDIYWADNSRTSVDPITQEQDFEGYRVYLTKKGFDVTKTPNLLEDFVKAAEFDIAGNGFFK